MTWGRWGGDFFDSRDLADASRRMGTDGIDFGFCLAHD